MKSLSVRQPHAGRILANQKKIEVRSKPTNHRGPLLICSCQKPVIEGQLSGHAICVVDVVDCVPFTPDQAHLACIPFVPNHFAWVLDNVKPIEPIKVKGALGFFDVQLPESNG